MLKAVLSGKAGKLDTIYSGPFSWRQALRCNEDIITATLFERLAYLPGSIAWDILRRTFPNCLPHYQLAKLERVEFWPRWDEQESDGTVEPDVYLRWVVGDPAKRIDLILEAKRGSLQYADQWRRQQAAYHLWIKEEDEGADRVVFLGIGGIRKYGAEAAEKISAAVREMAAGVEAMDAAVADWSDLAAALYQTKPDLQHVKHIVRDMLDALAEFGYNHIHLSTNIVKLERLRAFRQSIRTISRMQSEV